MLDAFDGIVAKGGELVVVMTTNRIERIHKGMFRPGRLDALIPIEGLDRGSVEDLVKVYVTGGQLEDVNYDEVYAAMEEFSPAFVREAVTRATSVALARVDGRPQYNITTGDLVTAANTLRPQLEQMQAANEGEAVPTLEAALGGTLRRSLDGGKLEHGTDSPLVLSLNGNGSS